MDIIRGKARTTSILIKKIDKEFIDNPPKVPVVLLIDWEQQTVHRPTESGDDIEVKHNT